MWITQSAANVNYGSCDAITASFSCLMSITVEGH